MNYTIPVQNAKLYSLLINFSVCRLHVMSKITQEKRILHHYLLIAEVPLVVYTNEKQLQAVSL